MKKIKAGNIYEFLPAAKRGEVFEAILSRKGVKVERITSFGQSTPKGEWLKEKKNEWVVLLKGRAVLRFKGAGKTLSMSPGDHVFIPSGKAHRVDRTASKEKSVWLAVYF